MNEDALIREFASGCDVGLVGSSHLAAYAEAELGVQPRLPVQQAAGAVDAGQVHHWRFERHCW